MFPPAGSEIYTNEAGEPTGWGRPESAEDYYCNTCGFSHGGECVDERDIEIARQDSTASFYDDEVEEPPIEEHDPGPEIDDEGGMSEYRQQEPTVQYGHNYNFED